MCIYNNININFKQCTAVIFDINNSKEGGGAVYASKNCLLTITESPTLTFRSNKAKIGGAILGNTYSRLALSRSKVVFLNNKASSGGAMQIAFSSSASFGTYAVAVFSNNTADKLCGALCISDDSYATCVSNSKLTFSSNNAVSGGAIYLGFSSNNFIISFTEGSLMAYKDNHANMGGVVEFHENCNVTIGGNSTLLFENNNACSDVWWSNISWFFL